MKKQIKLTESDLNRIVKRVINEWDENTLYRGIKSLIRDSNSGHEEVVSILKTITDEMESGREMRNSILKRFRN
jgi:hypothetical protein